LKFFNHKFKIGYKCCKDLNDRINENLDSNCKHGKHVNKILRQEICNQQYLSWAFVFEFFLNKPDDIKMWNITKRRLETTTTDFISMLKFVTSGSYADFDITELTRLSAISSEITVKMDEKQQMLQGNLSYTTNRKSERWCCVNCEKTYSENVDICDTIDCNTCRKHGIQDCLMKDCKLPTWKCKMCTFEQSTQIEICTVCSSCLSHNILNCPQCTTF
jgi:hypothetical protein